ncbi:MAG: hypothetical protein WB930_00990 [Syntrophobacteraceae bacterium]
MRFSAPAMIWSLDWKWENAISRPNIVLHWSDFNQIISQAGAGRSFNWKDLVNAVVFSGMVWYELHESIDPAIEWVKRLTGCKRR